MAIQFRQLMIKFFIITDPGYSGYDFKGNGHHGNRPSNHTKFGCFSSINNKAINKSLDAKVLKGS